MPTSLHHTCALPAFLAQFYRWTAPSAGFLTVYTCSDAFESMLTVYGDGVDADGKPIKNGNLGCGGVFRNCKDPNLKDPDSQLM